MLYFLRKWAHYWTIYADAKLNRWIFLKDLLAFH